MHLPLLWQRIEWRAYSFLYAVRTTAQATRKIFTWDFHFYYLFNNNSNSNTVRCNNSRGKSDDVLPLMLMAAAQNQIHFKLIYAIFLPSCLLRCRCTKMSTIHTHHAHTHTNNNIGQVNWRQCFVVVNVKSKLRGSGCHR